MDADLRVLAEAVPDRYRGPWRWHGQKGKGGFMRLSTVHHGRLFVMGFERQGMSGAQPQFPVAREPRDDGWVSHVMTKADEIAVTEVDYRNDIDYIDNPFATWIAAASPQAVLALYERIAALEARPPGVRERVSRLLRR